MKCARTSILLILVLSFLVHQSVSAKESEEKVPEPGKISQIINLLKKSGFEPVILKDAENKIIVVTPDLVGRVLCVGFDGVDGPTNSYLSQEQIKKGFSGSGKCGVWNDFGGEERIWFAPEGGKYGFFFLPHAQQDWDNYTIPAAMNETRYKVIEQPEDGKSVKFSAPIKLINYNGSKITLDVTRQVTILDYCPFTLGLGDNMQFVGFESKTWAKNTGKNFLQKETSPVSIWTVGMFRSTRHTVVILPFKQGPVSELDEPVTTEYFRYFAEGGKMPENYWSVKNGCVLLKADGQVQTKIELSKRRSLGRLASIDLENLNMTIVDFEMYPELDYTASFFLPYNGNLLDGGALSSFVPKARGEPTFHELECCSPIMDLQPGEQFCHISRTYHLKGRKEALSQICKTFFNCDLATLTEFDAISGQSVNNKTNRKFPKITGE